jgi:hypothetical protein
MERENKGLDEEDWNIEALLKKANEHEVRICHLYEFGREVCDLEWLKENSRLSLGKVAITLEHPEFLNDFFWFCLINYAGLSDDGWFKVPFFRLPSDFREEITRAHARHLSNQIDGRLPLDRGPTMHLEVPIGMSTAQFHECFESYRELNIPKGMNVKTEIYRNFGRTKGARAPIRQMKTDLRSLGALRLLRRMTVENAKAETKKILETPLYSNPSDWSRAKKRAEKRIKAFEADIRPIKELLEIAPKNITYVSREYSSGKVKYGRKYK